METVDAWGDSNFKLKRTIRSATGRGRRRDARIKRRGRGGLQIKRRSREVAHARGHDAAAGGGREREEPVARDGAGGSSERWAAPGEQMAQCVREE